MGDFCGASPPGKLSQSHVWYIYLHLPYKNQPNVGKYTSPMDTMGMTSWEKTQKIDFSSEGLN